VLEVEPRIFMVMFSLMLIMGFSMLVDLALASLLWLRWEVREKKKKYAESVVLYV